MNGKLDNPFHEGIGNKHLPGNFFVKPILFVTRIVPALRILFMLAGAAASVPLAGQTPTTTASDLSGKQPALYVAGTVQSDVAVSLIGTARFNGTESDKSGIDGALPDGTPNNQFGGLSAIEWVGGNRFLVLSDRGPGDGSVPYICRFHEVEIGLNQSAEKAELSCAQVRTVLFHDVEHRPFPGSSQACAVSREFNTRLDPEGMRRDKTGNLYVSDEYGPRLLKFNEVGDLTGEIKVPAPFHVEKELADGILENNSNTSGRCANRGLEGLALSPCGRYLTGIMQSPLLQDCRRAESGMPMGTNSRIIRYDLQTGEYSQFVYHHESDQTLLHEILAIDADHYLVIEDDGARGADAKCKRIFLIDVSVATPVTDDCVLPAASLPENIHAAGKSLFVDLLDPAFGLAAEIPEKVEGLSWGPEMPNGKNSLFVCTDNDFSRSEQTLIYVFAIR
jgi:hypothetical protein